MKIFLLFICALELAVPAASERVALINLNDTNVYQPFSRLTEYQDAPGSLERLNVTQRAFRALLIALTPAIRNLTNYTGIFSGNCSVFFEESIESAACDINPAETRTLQPTAGFVSNRQLPQSYWEQIGQSHILLATVFADWVKGMIQEYSTDLYFKQSTCNDTAAPPTPYPPTPVPTTAVPPTPVPTTAVPPTPVPTTAVPPTPAPTPPSAGLLAAWSQTGGTYADATNQPGRYNASNGVVADALTGIEWEQAASASAMNWTAAQAYCANQTTGNLTGWRLPNIGELQTLVDYAVVSAVPMNSSAFPTPPVANLWSATSDAGSAGNSWFVHFSGYAYSYWHTVATTDKVRCVRSSYTPPSGSRYALASGEAADIVTGLIWQRVSPVTGGPNNGGTYNQSGASTYCSGLGLNLQTWRLPTIKELSTLIDYSVSQGSLMMGAEFAGEPMNRYWSSTVLAGNPINAWFADFGNGYLDYGVLITYNVGSSLAVRCVR